MNRENERTEGKTLLAINHHEIEQLGGRVKADT